MPRELRTVPPMNRQNPVLQASLTGVGRRGSVLLAPLVITLSFLAPTSSVMPEPLHLDSAPAAPGITKGSPCQKPGLKKTLSAVTYVCKTTRTGKLQWSAIKTSTTPKPTPQPSGISKAAATTTEISPNSTMAPTGNNDKAQPIEENVGGSPKVEIAVEKPMVPVWAFASISTDTVASHLIKVEVGPNSSSKNFDPIVEGLQRSALIFQSALKRLDLPPVREFPVVLADSNDVNWFIEKVYAYGHGSPVYAENLRNRIASEGSNLYAAGVSTVGNNPLLQLLRSPAFPNKPGVEFSIGAHEYTHAVQTSLGAIRALPCWSAEGSATYFGNRVAITAFDGNGQVRNGLEGVISHHIRTSSQMKTAISDGQLYEILRSADDENSPSCTFPGKVGYTIGLFVSEAQANQWGDDAMIRWWARSGQVGWGNAWVDIYGIDADTWLKEIGIPYAQQRIAAFR